MSSAFLAGWALPSGVTSPVLKTVATVLVAVTAVTFGDILMAQAMRKLGPVKVTGLSSIVSTWWRIFSTPKVWAAIACMATFFFLWQAVLSWADLTFVLPLTALTYVLNAFLAGPFLGETVTPLRWAGCILITLGVALVALSET